MWQTSALHCICWKSLHNQAAESYFSLCVAGDLKKKVYIWDTGVTNILNIFANKTNVQYHL